MVVPDTEGELLSGMHQFQELVNKGSAKQAFAYSLYRRYAHWVTRGSRIMEPKCGAEENERQRPNVCQFARGFSLYFGCGNKQK